MKNAQFTYHNDKLTKWSLTVTLLFSIFTFSGYAGNYHSRKPHTTQTELVISSNQQPGKRSISYKKALELSNTNDFFTSSYSWKNALFTYDILTKVKLDSISKQFYSHRSADRLAHVKTIPQSSEEDILVTVIG